MTRCYSLIDNLAEKKNDKALNAVIQVARYVAIELLNQKALLLPHVSRLFLSEYGVDEYSMYNVEIETEDTTLKYTSRWLLNQLILHLGVHMNYKCIHKKYGVMLYI